MTKEVWAIKDIKVHYSKIIADLIFQKFSALVYGIQKRSDQYRDYIAGQYYLFLAKSLL